MKLLAVLGTLVALGSLGVLYQDEILDFTHGPHGPGGPRHERNRDPIFVLFDADDDETLSASEMEKAVEILKARDTNSDGVLTRDELPRPPRPLRGGRQRDDHKGNPPTRSENSQEPRLTGERPRHQDATSQRSRPSWDEDVDTSLLKSGTLVFQGGYETDARDGGRPVALIAAALGVRPHVFRDAFSNVQPSRSGPPSASRAHANKQVLMDALGPHGVTNDHLDEVSNYYRYRPENGESWPHRAAKAVVEIRQGKPVAIRVVEPGHGYLTPPHVTIAGFEDVQIEVEMGYSSDFESNGRVVALRIHEAAAD